MAACLPIVGIIGTVMLVEYDDDDDNGSFRALAAVSRQRKAARAALAMPPSSAPHSRVFAPISPNGTPYAPDDLFCAGSAPAKPDVRRYISINDGRTALMFTDGVLFEPTSRRDDQAITYNYWRPAEHGWDSKEKHSSPVSFMPGIRTSTDNGGPRHTLRRAKLAAVCKALHSALSMCGREMGFRRVVIATDEHAVVQGADRVDEWARKGWKKSNGRAVQDEDLWRIFLQRASDLEKDGVRVAIWHVRHSTSAGETNCKR